MSHTAQPLHFTQQQQWAEDQVVRSHDEVLFAFGEYAMFILMWHADDFAKGRVGRCLTCYAASGRASAAYDQGARQKCPDCFGSTFEGGYRAKIIRPALITDPNTDTTDEAPRGPIESNQVTLETTPDFSFNHGDFVLRAGNLRYMCEEARGVVVRSGFDNPDLHRSITNNIASARLEDPQASAAYLIPPVAQADLDAILLTPRNAMQHLPSDMSVYEEIRGALVV